ncbi:histone chaperone Rttp106-like-domain-containing protein [Radiomyces spectabilis]|uniref:histone chaperone Rttp106-like-domain-containing protein n=1 Tax=Radiomyces spectabilis TaxID=64574 RepID=UPI00221F6A3E|nr:histone chaperone Rttp106-like-domain-containing protein [Radiomyces spectabilis]KAI8379486.1 histone chaperone Rttp106-like-domain-containing protein [Radiomyces spectabilis]
MGVCVPTPEKTAKSFTFALFLNGDSDAIVFNVQDKGDISVTQSGQAQTLGENKHEYICQLLKKHASIQITRPEKKCFASSGVSPTTGKPEERYHVNSYLKTKDGSLFFLPGGILFGFKKPTLFFPLASLASTEITNITQRTFDLTLKLKDGCTALGSGSYTEATVQFSMIEQTEYTAIDAYIKKSNINDTSMSEEKKAPEPKPKKSEQGDNPAEIDEEEQDEDFQPSDEDHDPLEYDTSAESEDDQDADNNDASDMDEDSQHEDNEDEEDEEEENDDENEEDIKEEERADDDEVDLLEDSD